MPEEKTLVQWLEQGDTFYDQNNSSEALECYEKAVELDPDCYNAYMGKSRALRDISSNKEASALAKGCDILRKDISVAYTIIDARALSCMGNHEDAIKGYDKALELDFNNIAAMKGKIIILHCIGLYAKPSSCFDKANATSRKEVFDLHKKTVEIATAMPQSVMKSYDEVL